MERLTEYLCPPVSSCCSQRRSFASPIRVKVDDQFSPFQIIRTRQIALEHTTPKLQAMDPQGQGNLNGASILHYQEPTPHHGLAEPLRSRWPWSALFQHRLDWFARLKFVFGEPIVVVDSRHVTHARIAQQCCDHLSRASFLRQFYSTTDIDS